MVRRPISIWRFIEGNSVDFIGMLQQFARAGVLVFVSAFVGTIVAIRMAAGEVAAEIEADAREIGSTLSPTGLASQAAAVSAGELEVFGIAGLPVSVAIALAAAGALAAAYYVFIGGLD